MKSRQLGFVLMALIAVGVAGLIFRIVSAGSDEIVLEGLVQVSREASDRVLINDAEKQTEMVRLGDAEQATWFVDDQPVFIPRLEQFWQAVDDLYDAQLVSINPANHPPLGVVDGQSIEVSFFIGGRSLQEKFLVGEWQPDVRLCYVRRAGHEETYGVPCPGGNIFEPDPDRWKNPVVAAIPPNEILEIQFTYPDEEFVLRPDDEGEWFAHGPDGSEDPINPFALNSIIGTLQLVVASGFAEEEEGDKLNFAVPDAMVRVITREDASTPSTRLRFLRRDDLTSYLSIPTTGTVYIVDNQAVGGLLLRLGQMIEVQDGEGG